ncbi:uncharacterized protein [Fopius arisanus]|uniref:Uncharacterized protein isoform X2 n=1 Tax=Fopius arisanus TaxID=64838 RepID=A0A9R1T5J7_9HYME|nr:PREDICTED: uncharacterized protein LOC105266660 isoform X2 [Fopius arisanus]
MMLYGLILTRLVFLFDESETLHTQPMFGYITRIIKDVTENRCVFKLFDNVNKSISEKQMRFNNLLLVDLKSILPQTSFFNLFVLLRPPQKTDLQKCINTGMHIYMIVNTYVHHLSLCVFDPENYENKKRSIHEWCSEGQSYQAELVRLQKCIDYRSRCSSRTYEAINKDILKWGLKAYNVTKFSRDITNVTDCFNKAESRTYTDFQMLTEGLTNCIEEIRRLITDIEKVNALLPHLT